MICDVLSKALITGLACDPIEAAANPKKIEKITICNISFVAIASTTLFGMMCSTKFCAEKPSVF